MSEEKKDKIYYDESCHVCSWEINKVRKKGESCGIEFIDISSPDFGFADRDFESEMIGEFGGEETIGAETFRRMYEKIGFGGIVAITRQPIIKQVFDASYWVFAHCIRPYLPKKKTP